MQPDDFRSTLSAAAPPPGMSDALQALWWDGKHDWNRAHECAQRDGGPNGCAVHAYLHRKEGDLSNAGYWYNRAGRPVHPGSLSAEWDDLVREFLKETNQ